MAHTTGWVVFQSRNRIDERVEGAEEMIEDDPECADDYEADIMTLRRRGARLRSSQSMRGFGSTKGVATRSPPTRGWGWLRPAAYGSGPSACPTGLDTTGAVPDLLDRCRRGDPLPALAAGRSRWYRGGRDATDEAHQLMGPPTPSSGCHRGPCSPPVPN